MLINHIIKSGGISIAWRFFVFIVPSANSSISQFPNRPPQTIPYHCSWADWTGNFVNHVHCQFSLANSILNLNSNIRCLFHAPQSNGVVWMETQQNRIYNRLAHSGWNQWLWMCRCRTDFWNGREKRIEWEFESMPVNGGWKTGFLSLNKLPDKITSLITLTFVCQTKWLRNLSIATLS